MRRDEVGEGGTRGPKPANPDYVRMVEDAAARQGFMRALEARLVTVEPGRVVMELPFSDAVSQHMGLFHGGIIGALGDNAGGFAALSLMPAGSEVVTVEYKINFMRAALGRMLRAEGVVIRPGRSLSVVKIEIDVIGEDRAQACALMQATMMRMDGKG